ncbi:uncharacterized protein LOC112692928 [Sipha flava]|uniref:Uncharacterized protein LOC112692928 n=1 Tax=Sipha flava TaxID=143950 RepID=A0A8B8GLR5_9HEMI|nr:uncharacterized protein LOC112692928 [Sipha flava]
MVLIYIKMINPSIKSSLYAAPVVKCEHVKITSSDIPTHEEHPLIRSIKTEKRSNIQCEIKENEMYQYFSTENTENFYSNDAKKKARMELVKTSGFVETKSSHARKSLILQEEYR